MHAVAPRSVVDHATHTPYSDPGPGAALLDAVPTDLDELSAVVRNVIVHYRASGLDLPADTVSDIHARWMDRILELDQLRHGTPLAAPREPTTRVQGCCRDHTLLSVAILRQHGIPARSRIGFADYFVDDWHHDHVIPEVWTGDRWQRFDPEVERPGERLPEPRNIPQHKGFHTAAEVWRGYRAGTLDVETYGVDRSVPVARGAWFVRNYVILEVAHRFGDELLLWDNWGAMSGPGGEAGDVGLIDDVAELLIAADRHDLTAEQELLRIYRSDERLRPGASVLRADLPAQDMVRDQLRDQ